MKFILKNTNWYFIFNKIVFAIIKKYYFSITHNHQVIRDKVNGINSKKKSYEKNDIKNNLDIMFYNQNSNTFWN